MAYCNTGDGSAPSWLFSLLPYKIPVPGRGGDDGGDFSRLRGGLLGAGLFLNSFQRNDKWAFAEGKGSRSGVSGRITDPRTGFGREASF